MYKAIFFLAHSIVSFDGVTMSEYAERRGIVNKKMNNKIPSIC